MPFFTLRRHEASPVRNGFENYNDIWRPINHGIITAPPTPMVSNNALAPPPRLTFFQADENISMSAQGKVETLEGFPLDRDLVTRNLCYVSLALGWAISIASLTAGTYIIAKGPQRVPPWLLGRLVDIGVTGLSWDPKPDPAKPIQSRYAPDHRVFSVPQGAMLTITLLLSIVLAHILDTVNFVHATSLRWQLWAEGRYVGSISIHVMHRQWLFMAPLSPLHDNTGDSIDTDGL